MASTASTAATATTDSFETGVSLTRLYVLRATYLLLIAGLGALVLPSLLNHGPMARGVIPTDGLRANDTITPSIPFVVGCRLT